MATAGKRMQINKANTVIVAAIAVSSFLVVFSLVAGRALISQRAYQSRVIAKKEKARNQLRSNLSATDTLISSYKTFVGTPENILGGNPTGEADKDGDNAKIILDALPSKYDFPALATSLEKLITQDKLTINSITGSDDELAQATNQSANSPKPVDMPFEINVTGNYTGIKKLISTFELSIRPFYIDSLTFSGTNKELQLDMKAKTYYQPEKNLTVRTELVR